MLPSKVLILLVAACLVWVGLLSLAFVALSGTTASTGFILAGALVGAVVAWVLVMIREIKDSLQAQDLSSCAAHQEGDEEEANPAAAGLAAEISGRPVTGRRGMTPGLASKTRPRKVRSHWAVLSEPASR